MGVKTSQMTEREYRASEEDSYSTVKDFLSDRKKYYRKHILGETIKEKNEDSEDIILGSLTHKLLSDADNWEDDFEIAMNNKPTGQMLDFCNKLYEKSLEATSLEGVVTKPIQVLMEEAFNEVKYDKDGNEVAFKKKELSYVIEKFEGTNCEEYYQQLRRSSTKYIINGSTLTNANNIAEGLKQSSYTRGIVNAVTEKNIEVFNELQIFFEVDGHPFKGMLDRVIVDHTNKIISPYDYKISWNVEDFQYNYRKRMYHLQVASYYKGLFKWTEENNLDDYFIEYLKYIVADSINYMQPLIYETDEYSIKEGLEGYYDIYGDYHPGLIKALNDISWHKENNIWDISKDNYENNGVVKLKSLARAI